MLFRDPVVSRVVITLGTATMFSLDGSPGAPIPEGPRGTSIYQATQDRFGASIWSPFCSQTDWEVARWAKLSGPSSSALTELLAIPKVHDRSFLGSGLVLTITLWTDILKIVDKLELSYTNANELNAIIDKKLPGRPPFKTRSFVIANETLTLYYRDIIQCIRTIYGDPEFTQDLILAPERHYTDHERVCRVYNEMHTGDWWWAVQVCKSFLRAQYTKRL